MTDSPSTIGEPPLPAERAAIEPADRAALESAWQALERVTFASRITGLFGRQIESATSMIPARVKSLANRATAQALNAAMRTALRSLPAHRAPASDRLHRTLATAAGAAGGAFGLVSLPLELPVSTVLLLRSIADIARAEGEDLADPEAALACMQVFALGGRTPEDDYLDSSYFAVRAVLARTISEAAKVMAATAVADESAPILVRFISQIASRFGLAVTQKFAVQAVPIVGAAGGAAVNYAFMEHFQSLARGHFTIRRLERTYGADTIRSAYEEFGRSRPRPGGAQA